MKQSTDGIINFMAGGVLTLLLFGQFAFNNSDKNKSGKNDREIYQWQPPALPKEISFANEPVPISRWDVKERLDRELLFNSYSHANILFLIKLSKRYFPIISERLAANGVPDDFKFLCVAESNLIPGAISRSGATSFWQFLDKTAPGYNLTANDVIDERYDIIKSTDAACIYFKQAYAKFGTWTAAAASYNCGQGGYNAQATFQQSKYYYDLLLPEETNRYIFRILAFKHILSNASDLGFTVAEEEKYAEIPYRLVEVKSSINNLAQFAIDNGSSYKILKLMNPWIRSRSLPVTGGKTYQIKLPAE